MGGIYATIPFGMCVGILNNIGAWLVIKYVPYISFKSNQSQRQAVFVTIFVMNYMNSGLFVSWLPELNNHTGDTATNLSNAWVQTFGIMIFSSTITTNVTPYIAVLFDIISQKCCNKKKRS